MANPPREVSMRVCLWASIAPPPSSCGLPGALCPVSCGASCIAGQSAVVVYVRKDSMIMWENYSALKKQKGSGMEMRGFASRMDNEQLW